MNDMHFVSTKSNLQVSIEEAIFGGTAPDGGLFVPSVIPEIDLDDFKTMDNYQEFSTQFLSPYFVNSVIKNNLECIINESLNFDVILNEIDTGKQPLSMLELFHGPTAAFKDFGARFLSSTMKAINQKSGNSKINTILVATSGDTGGAVASAFHNQPGFHVVILFPKGRVSPRQQHQLTCWGDNVTSIAVEGEFDDCQRLVKAAFNEDQVIDQNLCSANSINIGRLLPQATYYAWSSMQYFKTHNKETNFVIPTGNLGNAFACFIAKKMGFPIGKIVFSTNANKTITDFIESSIWEPRNTIPTLASAMDVGNPSNMERFFHSHDSQSLGQLLEAYSVNDQQIKEQIKKEYNDHQIICCPHTATAFNVYRGFSDSTKDNNHWSLVSTAHPAKFENIVEPIIDEVIKVPASLSKLLKLDSSFISIEPRLEKLMDIIL